MCVVSDGSGKKAGATRGTPSVTLEELHRRFVAARRKIRRLANASVPESGNWAAWNTALENAVALTDRIARAKAETTRDLLIKITAVQWWCLEFDAFIDNEGCERIAAFARELRRYARHLPPDARNPS